MDLTITCTTRDGVPVIAVAGEIDVYNSGRLRDPVREAAKASSFVLDLEGCEFLDSTGLGVIVGGFREARMAGHRLAVNCPRPSIRKVFQITGLAKVFPVRDTLDEAVKEVSGGN